MLGHIVDRFIIHFFSSAGLVLATAHGIRVLTKILRNTDWLPAEWKMRLVLSGLLVFAFSTLREAHDIANGQPLIKAYTDYASWLLGCGFSVWGLYRFVKDHTEVPF